MRPSGIQHPDEALEPKGLPNPAVTAALYLEVYTVGLQDQGLSCSFHLAIC